MLADAVIDTLSEYAPNLRSLDCSSPGHYARRPRVDLRADGRAHLSWRALVGSAVHDASASRVGAISHADCGPLPVRRRDSSRIWSVRTVRNEREPRNPQGYWRRTVNGHQNLPRKLALAKAAATEAAARISAAIESRDRARIVAATGTSQIEFLDELTRASRRGLAAGRTVSSR